MEAKERQLGELFGAPWVFVKDHRGGAILCANNGGTMVPIFVFDHPEMFHSFVADALDAERQFIPKSLRDAIKVTETVGWRGEEEDEPYAEEPPELGV
jgi:hypothetical protein